MSTTMARPLVLVAEDDPEMRSLVVRALGRDHDVESVSDGAKLFARLARPPAPALVVTDLRMPWMDGLDALRRAGRWVPAIVVTAFPDADVERRVEQADVELLAKPFDLDHLRARVAKLIASISPWSEPDHDGYSPLVKR